MNTVVKNNDLKGYKIRGILILVGVSLIWSFLAGLSRFLNVLAGENFVLLITPGSDYYFPSVELFLKLEMFSNFIFLILYLYLIFIFFKKDKRFPKFYIIFLLITLFFSIVEYILIPTLPLNFKMIDYNPWQELGKSIIFSLIWIFYILKSERVKATFIN
jgi:hypothetical protein